MDKMEVQDVNSEEEWRKHKESNCEEFMQKESPKDEVLQVPKQKSLKGEAAIPHTDAMQLKDGAYTKISHWVTRALAVISSIKSSLCIGVVVGLAVFIALHVQAKPVVNNTVYVLVRDENASNNSLLIDLDEIISSQSNLSDRITIMEARTQEHISNLYAKAENNTNAVINLRDQLSSVNSTLSTQLTRIQGNIDRLNSSQNVHQTSIATLQTDLNNLTTQVSDNVKSLAEHGERFSDIDTRFEAVEQTAADAENDIIDLKYRVFVLESKGSGDTIYPPTTFTVLFLSFVTYYCLCPK